MQDEKAVWIDEEHRVLAFQPMANGKRITKTEPLFWDYIMKLVKSGYRIM